MVYQVDIVIGNLGIRSIINGHNTFLLNLSYVEMTIKYPSLIKFLPKIKRNFKIEKILTNLDCKQMVNAKFSLVSNTSCRDNFFPKN